MKKRRKRKTPLSGGTEQQRNGITQSQYIEAIRILQGWGYEEFKKWWDVENVVAAVQLAGGRV